MIGASGRRAIIISAAVLALQAGPLSGLASAQTLSACRVGTEFTALVKAVGTAVVGDCMAEELVVSGTGDRFQSTSRGLLISSTSGWTAFTDGQTTWIDGAAGLGVAGPQPLTPATPVSPVRPAPAALVVPVSPAAPTIQREAPSGTMPGQPLPQSPPAAHPAA